mgnify:CR=1 FL=1|tara:strand:+ start:7178 stop:8164 length:987 start_codon:yes stop_codon:yes gene_type:complete
MTHGSLFSGIGGFDLAAQWMGWENVFHVERDPFCRQVLSHHFPKSQSFDDVKTFDATHFCGRVSVISGGFPCQPFSAAGKRAGTSDDRYLWPEMFRIIREACPTYVVAENVRGLISWNEGMVLDTVCADLEGEGYEVFPVVLPAASVNAPHRRDRIWIVAYANDKRGACGHRQVQGTYGEVPQRYDHAQSRYASAADATDANVQRPPFQPIVECRWQKCKRQGHKLWDNISEKGQISDATNADGAGERQDYRQGEPRQLNQESASRDWQDFPTVAPVCGGNDGLPQRLDSITFSKWRRESIKAYGNAIVPQVALQIFRAIEQDVQGRL